MKPADKLALIAFGVGALVAGLVYWYVSDEGPWWMYAIIAVFVGGIGYQTLLEQVSRERIVNRDHTPR